MTFGSRRFVSYLFPFFFLAACADVPIGLPARGTVAGQTIDTHVDSEVASYYLSHYLAKQRSHPEFDARIDRVYRDAKSSLPERGELQRVSETFSTDFAALYFADRIARDPVSRRFRGEFKKGRTSAQKALEGNFGELPAEANRYEVLFVPGYLYREHSYTGADFTVSRSALDEVGVFHHFVETDEDASIEANADLVVSAIQARAGSGRRLLVVSASKSGSEVALALTQLGSAGTGHVGAWLNIVGTLQGSFLADEGIQQEHEALFGEVDPIGVESLTTVKSRQRFSTFRIPESVLIVNYIGIPLTGTISSWSEESYRTLQPYGPNDGLSLLADLLMPGGVTVAEVGRDHFLLGEGIDVTTVALAIAVIRWLEHGPIQAGQFSEPKNRIGACSVKAVCTISGGLGCRGDRKAMGAAKNESHGRYVYFLWDDWTWWAWTVTAVLLVIGLWGAPVAFLAAMGLTIVQGLVFWFREKSIGAFAVQLRLAYLLLLGLCYLPQLRWLYWVPMVGTLALVIFGYCLLARILSLFPWNRSEEMSSDLLRRTFLSRPDLSRLTVSPNLAGCAGGLCTIAVQVGPKPTEGHEHR